MNILQKAFVAYFIIHIMLAVDYFGLKYFFFEIFLFPF